MEEIEIGPQDQRDPVGEKSYDCLDGRGRPSLHWVAVLVADEAQIEVAVVAARFSHVLHLLPGLQLGVIVRAVFGAIPFPEEQFHLQMIEHGFAERINASLRSPRSSSSFTTRDIASLDAMVLAAM